MKNDIDINYYLTKFLAILSVVIFVLICWRKINTEENKKAIEEVIEKTKQEQQIQEKNTLDDNIYIWTDPETGVEYIIWEGYRKGGITPRIKP